MDRFVLTNYFENHKNSSDIPMNTNATGFFYDKKLSLRYLNFAVFKWAIKFYMLVLLKK